MVSNILNNLFINDITNKIILFLEHPTSNLIKKYFEEQEFIKEYEQTIININNNEYLLYSENEYYYNNDFDNINDYI